MNIYWFSPTELNHFNTASTHRILGKDAAGWDQALSNLGAAPSPPAHSPETALLLYLSGRRPFCGLPSKTFHWKKNFVHLKPFIVCLSNICTVNLRNNVFKNIFLIAHQNTCDSGLRVWRLLAILPWWSYVTLRYETKLKLKQINAHETMTKTPFLA